MHCERTSFILLYYLRVCDLAYRSVLSFFPFHPCVLDWISPMAISNYLSLEPDYQIIYIIYCNCFLCLWVVHICCNTDHGHANRGNKYATQKRVRSPFAVYRLHRIGSKCIAAPLTVRQLNTLLYFLSTVSILLSAPMMVPHSKTLTVSRHFYHLDLCDLWVHRGLHTAHCSLHIKMANKMKCNIINQKPRCCSPLTVQRQDSTPITLSLHHTTIVCYSAIRFMPKWPCVHSAYTHYAPLIRSVWK